MNLDQLLDHLKADPAFMACVSNWEVLPPREARYGEIPACMDDRVTQALTRRGITRLYTHQSSAVLASAQGKDIVVVTPTASGKTM